MIDLLLRESASAPLPNTVLCVCGPIGFFGFYIPLSYHPLIMFVMCGHIKLNNFEKFIPIEKSR